MKHMTHNNLADGLTVKDLVKSQLSRVSSVALPRVERRIQNANDSLLLYKWGS